MITQMECLKELIELYGMSLITICIVGSLVKIGVGSTMKYSCRSRSKKLLPFAHNRQQEDSAPIVALAAS